MNNDLFKQLASSDYFFFYGSGQVSVEDECKHDLFEVLIQPHDSLFFMRDFGAGVKDFENYPVGLMMMINIPYNIANSVAWRNTMVSDGSDEFPDRRIAISQKDIQFSKDDMGNVDFLIPYYLYSDISRPGKARSMNFPTAGAK